MRPALPQVFNLPIEEAAKHLGIGQTMLKHYCRKFGIPRWPYRKRQSVVQLIGSIEEYAQVRAELRMQVSRLCNSRSWLVHGPFKFGVVCRHVCAASAPARLVCTTPGIVLLHSTYQSSRSRCSSICAAAPPSPHCRLPFWLAQPFRQTLCTAPFLQAGV
eukprot:GHRQ01031639.1.p1 GENE.GHRQ01031639.1~~GHRQ01031639.1.p1  ORF type:complete len:160 (+),score=19.01 GHRQ01031639.1:299-778(+)